MKTLMNAMALAALMAAASTAALCAPLCDRLAADAGRVKAAAWADGAKALRPMLRIDALNSAPSPFEAALADVPIVRQAVGGGSPDSFTGHLAGTDVYSVSTLQGTLHCQATAFLRARPGKPSHLIDAPARADVDGGLCWTRSGEFGQVYGQPAFIEHGPLTDRTVDEDIVVFPWTGDGWGPSCRLALRFRKTYTVTQQFCGDRDVCRAASGIAAAVARAHDRTLDAKAGRSAFRFGPPASGTQQAAVRRLVAARKASGGTVDFPTFGAKDDGYSYSYAGFSLFPLTLDGRAYVAAIGHDGLGWRQSGPTLLSVFADDHGRLKPLAGLVVTLSNGGLEKAIVSRR
jgi:hypothetical protein